MSRIQQDTVIDEEEEVCPLCVEEFDIQDRNFRPCPCGYQICQFCFNNIRQNLNGLCPACRREYNESTIEYKAISTEELKAEEIKKKRAQTERRKQEAQKREIESLNRKHLSGMRVLQRNLVYVTGLNPNIREDDLLTTLRGDHYFGQYGKIIKIVVNKRTGQGGPGGNMHPGYDQQQGASGLGVYVTFEKKEEAEKCIAAVDGSVNGDRMLRATHGTTKYCSAYLRNDTCPNKNCMFLHEPGEEAESFSRMELSTANSRQTKEQAASQLPAPLRAPVAAAAQSHDSHAGPSHHQSSHMSRTDSYSGDGESSALPVTANWAKNPPTPATRPASLVHQLSHKQAPPKAITPAPQVAPSSPAQVPRHPDTGKRIKAPKNVGIIGQPAAKQEPTPEEPPASPPPPPPPVAAPAPTPTPDPTPAKPAEPEVPQFVLDQLARLEKIQKYITNPKFGFVLSPNAFPPGEYEMLCKMPPMFDKHGGRRRREMMEKQKAQERAEREDSSPVDSRSETGTANQAPIGAGTGQGPPSISGQTRGTTPLQQQREKEGLGQQQLQALAALQHEGLQQSLRSQTPQTHLQQAQGFAPFQTPPGMPTPQHQQQQHQQGHTRQTSRYAFANEAASATNARSNAAHMAEQVRMMPTQQQQLQQQQQQHVAQLYNPSTPGLLGSVQQPPPGLKSAPTPPAPGLGGFPMGMPGGLSHLAGMGIGGSHIPEAEKALMREIMANRGQSQSNGASLLRAGEGKHDIPDPSILQARVAPAQHQMHQQGLQVGGHGQGTLFDVADSVPDDTPATKSPKLSRSMTPGITDSDFPALAPSKSQGPPKAAIGTPVGKKKESTKPLPAWLRDDKDKEAEMASETDPYKPTEKPAIPAMEKPVEKKFAGVKNKPKLPPVDTSLAPVNENAVSTPSKPSTPLVQTAASTPTVEKKQGPRMIRIVSKESVMSSPARTKTSTPNPEFAFSDTASIGTASSRPVSPPPGFGRKEKQPVLKGPDLANVPVLNVKSKSALKKERIAAQKEQERKEAEALAAANAKEIHAPVVGRMKKKEKKAKKAGEKITAEEEAADRAEEAAEERQSQAAQRQSPAQQQRRASVQQQRAPEPVRAAPQPSPPPAPPVQQQPVPQQQQQQQQQQQSPQLHQPQPQPSRGRQSIFTEEHLSRSPTPVSTASTQPSINPHHIISEIRDEEGTEYFAELEMFKPVAGLKWEHHISSDELQRLRSQLPPVTSSPPSTPHTCPEIEYEESTDHATLNLRGNGQFDTRLCVTPAGSILRGLTERQEDWYIDAEHRRLHEPTWARWTSIAPSNLNVDHNMVELTPHQMAASLTAAGNVARQLHLDPEQTSRLSTKEALDYLWNMVMPALPGYAQEHLEGLAQSMCRVSVGYDEQPSTVTVDVKVEGGVKELQKMVAASKKETEVYEKKVEKLAKRNRKIVGLTA